MAFAASTITKRAALLSHYMEILPKSMSIGAATDCRTILSFTHSCSSSAPTSNQMDPYIYPEECAELEEERNSWSQLYQGTKALILAYGPIIAYFIKSTYPLKSRELIPKVWIPLTVLDAIGDRFDVLYSLGAEKSLLDSTSKIRPYITQEPTWHEDRYAFNLIAKEFAEQLLVEDIHGCSMGRILSEEMVDTVERLGDFYSESYNVRDKIRKLGYYSYMYVKAWERCPKPRLKSISQMLDETLGRTERPEVTDSEDEEDEGQIYIRYYIYHEPIDKILDDVKKRRKEIEVDRSLRAVDKVEQRPVNPSSDNSTDNTTNTYNALYNDATESSGSAGSLHIEMTRIQDERSLAN